MRIRTIKPEFWRSDDITALSREHRLLFIGLWSYVDDNGVGLDDYRAIAAELFAFEDDPKEIRDYVREGLDTLSRVLRPGQTLPLVMRYEVDGKSFLYITGWSRHQRIDRPGRARFPMPPADVLPVTSDDGPDDDPDGDRFANPSREVREGPATGTGEQGNRGTGEQGKKTRRAAGARASIDPDGFAEFWNACPRKVGKGAARKAFVKACTGGPLRPGETRAVTLAARMAVYAEFWRASGTQEQFIPHPATWLNQERYDDPPPVYRPPVPVRLDPRANGGLGEGTAAERANAFLSLRGTRGPNGERLDGRGTG